MAAKARTKAVENARLIGSGGNINLIGAKLYRHKVRLQKSLKERGHTLPGPVRKKYEDILKALTISAALVGKIRCSPPFMSLELPKSKLPVRSRRSSTRRRR